MKIALVIRFRTGKECLVYIHTSMYNLVHTRLIPSWMAPALKKFKKISSLPTALHDVKYGLFKYLDLHLQLTSSEKLFVNILKILILYYICVESFSFFKKNKNVFQFFNQISFICLAAINAFTVKKATRLAVF
jgi:hypothetical protein